MVKIPKKVLRSIQAQRVDCFQRRPEVLLHGNIPSPLHGVAPRVLLGSKWWDKTRREAYKSTYYHCVACGVYKLNAQFRRWLEGHELYDIDYLLGRSYYLETVPLCHCCHNYIHSGRLSALLEAGKITHQKYAAIIQHGDNILRQAGLVKPLPYAGPFADWKDWRLVLLGKEYPPIYSNQAEWLEKMKDLDE